MNTGWAVSTRAPEQTRALGERLATLLAPGDVIALEGDLGAGKTALVKGVARGLGLPERDVRSPTFTLVDVHERGRLPLVHMDAYRLTGPESLVDLGVETVCRPDAALFVEWAGRVLEALPVDRLRLAIEHRSVNERRIWFGGCGPRSEALAQGLADLTEATACEPHEAAAAGFACEAARGGADDEPVDEAVDEADEEAEAEPGARGPCCD